MPITKAAAMVDEFQSYASLYEQNQELRRELQQMKAWKEAALQLEQKNARLLDLNNVRLDPKFTHVTGVVMADSGSPFRQSVLLNVGARDGVRDGLIGDPRRCAFDPASMVCAATKPAGAAPRATILQASMWRSVV
mgnify:CR=1 FL=1